MTATRCLDALTDLPDQTDRTTVVTGCTVGGLGFHVALELARRGGRVVLAGRSSDRLAAAEQAIRGEVPDAALDPLVVDVSDLTSVRLAASEAARFGPLHCLVNNAGIMATPYARTSDGFEQQLATNHLGPFLLTGLLLPQLVESGDGRVVAVSSQMHRTARRAPLGDPRHQVGRYSRWPAYAETKLANLLFTFELERRLREADLPVRATAAHPGYSGTHLVANGRFGRSSGGGASIVDAASRAIGQSPAMGALPLLMAATDDLPGGTYCGPGGPGEVRGLPRVVGTRRLARDEDAQRRLWTISEQADRHQPTPDRMDRPPPDAPGAVPRRRRARRGPSGRLCGFSTRVCTPEPQAGACSGRPTARAGRGSGRGTARARERGYVAATVSRSSRSKSAEVTQSCTCSGRWGRCSSHHSQ